MVIAPVRAVELHDQRGYRLLLPFEVRERRRQPPTGRNDFVRK
jgi:hypothetical protein